jgi:hypothetical protein
MEIRITARPSGEPLLDGKQAGLSTIQDVLEKADEQADWVLYYRETLNTLASPQALHVLGLIARRGLPLSISSKPDFSDYVDQFGRSHPRSLDGPPPFDSLQPGMPDVDLRRTPEDVFREARTAASRKTGAGGVVIVRPDRELIVLSSPPAVPETAKLAARMPAFIPTGRSCNIAAIGDTGFTMFRPAQAPSVQEASGAIPFLGFLIGWRQAGHRVWVFEGHPSALAAGVTDSEFLLLDSGMLPHLQPDWMAVVQHAMKPGGKVFLHDRTKYNLHPLAPSARPPGWRIAEPDGEASYANCLLTTLAKGTAESVTIVSGEPLPDLAELTGDPEELDWIAGLPFRYDLLNAGNAIGFLLNTAAKGKVDPQQNEWTLATKLVVQGAEPRILKFVFRRERKWLKTILHVNKL